MNIATIRDVAALAGVAVSTASRALGKGSASPETRRKVREAAEQLHFTPSATARQLSNGHTRIIAIAIPEETTFIFHDPFIAAVVSQLTVSLSKLGYLPFLALVDSKDESGFVRLLESSGAEGMVITSFRYSKTFVSVIKNFGKPTIFIGRPPDNLDYPYVDIDNRQGGRLAAGALLQKGRSKALMIAGPKDMRAPKERSQGFAEVFAQAGGEIEVDEGRFALQHGYEAMGRHIRSGLDADSVFAQSDQIAVGAMQAMREHGVRCPEDVSIVGFDNLDVANVQPLSLTTVAQPVSDMAKMATDILTKRIETGVWVTRKKIFEVKLITRGSV